VRKIADFLVNQGKKVVVLGDFNEGPSDEASPPENLATLFDTEGQLVDCYSLPDFDIGKRPGTYGSCGITNRFDYILISKNLSGKYRGGTVFRNGLWGDRKTRPTEWKTYDEITESSEQASDHAAVYIDLDI
jgi:endonuclease/exonuclease/phosphatase family metal-dependent hydrolase